jgi:hypothetical protein
MKDSSKLLNFNVNRDLNFKVFRGVGFGIRRNLSFDCDRALSFDVNRDLGFGKRGVVFRGYVCPICGAPVAKDAANCDECGVKFERTAREETKSRKKSWEREKTRKPPASTSVKKPPKVPKTKQRRSTFQCPVCSKLLYVGTAKCPGCNVAFSTSGSSFETSRPSKTSQASTGPVFCSNCNYKIPSADRFCRRCGSPRPKGTGGTTVSWDEYKGRDRKEGIISWDEYSNKG